MGAILVVDDEPSVRRTLALLLRRDAHQVVEADGVTTARRRLRHRAFDVVITDLRMPDGDGLDVIRAAKRACPATDVILWTAFAGWESAREAMRLGAVDYLEKGDDPDDVRRRVATVLRDRRALRAWPEPSSRARLLRSRAATRGARKMVTVLFADLRGSLELLAGRNLDQARAVLDDVVELMIGAVHRYGGLVNQVMGDGIMALFGAPLVLDDHALQACRAAVTMHQDVAGYGRAWEPGSRPDVRLRIGLASGPVIVRTLAADVRRDYTAVGLTTHLAARMEQLAPPGSTLVTAETARLAGDRVVTRGLGDVAVKGLRDRIAVFELRDVAGSDSTTPLAPRGRPS
jgi:class 3 adenylate cyclase